jgi:ADP-ribose pyrophosphatase
MADRIVGDSRFLRMIERDGWFFVERPNSKGVVTILPLTRDRRILFVEQHRTPLGRKVIEFPAGLMGDEAGHEGEDPVVAASRELVEETGYQAQNLELVATTATSPGMANEMVHFVLAWNLDRVGPGGGVDNENIVVHEVPIGEVRAWLREQQGQGLVIAAKVFAGLYFANERWR